MMNWFENPIFAKALQVERRKQGSGAQAWLRRYWVAAVIWLLPLGLMTLFNLDELLRSGRQLERIFEVSLDVSAFFMLLHCISKSTHSTLSGISSEKEKKTYDSLQATLLSPREIVGGKLLTGLWPVGRELAVTLPVALVMGLGSGQAVRALEMFLIMLSTSVVLAGVGLLCSYRASSTQAATQQSSLWVAALLFGGPLLAALTRGPFAILSPFGAYFKLFDAPGIQQTNPLPYVALTTLIFAGLWHHLCTVERQARRVK